MYSKHTFQEEQYATAKPQHTNFGDKHACAHADCRKLGKIVVRVSAANLGGSASAKSGLEGSGRAHQRRAEKDLTAGNHGCCLAELKDVRNVKKTIKWLEQ